MSDPEKSPPTQTIEAVSHAKTETKVERPISEILPLLGFLKRHFFETVALIIPLAGILTFAAGKSFNEGWYRMAGAPPSLFPSDAYEFVFQGIGILGPWIWVAVFIVSLILFNGIMSWVDTWLEQKNKILRNARKLYESSSSRRLRKQLIRASRSEHPKGEAYRNWKKIGPRTAWVERRKASKLKEEKAAPYTKVIATFILYLGIVVVIGIVLWLARSTVMKQAEVDGVRQYLGIYAAVTGRLPPQYDANDITEDNLRMYACQGRGELWKYRAVTILKSPDSVQNAAFTNAYLLRATDKFLFFLDQSGSTIRQVNHRELELKESSERPLSVVAQSCPKKS